MYRPMLDQISQIDFIQNFHPTLLDLPCGTGLKTNGLNAGLNSLISQDVC